MNPASAKGAAADMIMWNDGNVGTELEDVDPEAKAENITEQNMCLSCTVTVIFSNEYWRDLGIWVRGQSRSL